MQYANDIGGFSLDMHIKGIKEAFKGVRLNLKPAAREMLEQHGNKQVSEIYICRRPLSNKFNTLLGLINKVAGYSGTPHDRLFHLMIVLRLSDGAWIQLEKNEDINIENFKKSSVDEVRRLPTPEFITVGTMIKRAIEKFGYQRIFIYDAFSNNCQRFVLDVLDSNDIQATPDDVAFIIQDVSDLVPVWAQRIAKGVTSFYNRLKMAISGYGYQCSRNHCPACGGLVKNAERHARTNAHIKRILRVDY